MKAFSILAAAAVLAGLAACESGPDIPREAGVCYSVLNPEDKAAIDFVAVARDQANIEQCAARLEETRVRFERMGTPAPDEAVGVYQGRFIFIDRAGVWSSQTLDGGRFFLLRRSGDGRLVVPGAVEQAPG